MSFTDSSHWATSGGAVLSAAPLVGCRAAPDPADARVLRVTVRPPVSVLLQVGRRQNPCLKPSSKLVRNPS